MSGSLQLIREEHPSELIDIALAESERLNRLVEDFLDMTRRPVLAPRMTDLRALCADICAAFSRDPRFLSTVRASAHGEARAVVVDPDRMRQAVWNLVLNGAQAMPRGGEVTLTLQESEGGVELLVADEGVGVPEADRARIFDPFYTTRSGGTGLGLALVAQIVRGHGGKVELRARTSGTGTEVCMWLPREATFDA
jgi:signal transduction histidine kinase